MDRTDTIAWVISVCAVYLRLSQAKTLGSLVAAAMQCRRVSLAEIGRHTLGTAKHQIKRCWRFCDNDRIETADAMRGILAQAMKTRGKNKRKRLLVALDWVDIKGFQTLMAGVVLKGRSVPICWASTTNHVYDGHRSRNAFEESLLLVLRSMIAPEIKVILLADRGFGRTELARFCQRHGFHYIIRIGPKVQVRTARFCGKLLDYPVHKGICKLLTHVSYRSHHPVEQHIVVRWLRGLPAKRDECWFLMTDLKQGPAQLSNLYARRMTIEQLFRDHKSKRNGWSLRDTQIQTPQRLDRLLLILAIAYLLLCGLGLIARSTHRPSAWCSTTRQIECSIFQIGLIMLRRINASPPTAVDAVLCLMQEVVPKWG
jgi:hypothetical protein